MSCALFSIGLYGVLSRRDIVAILASIEVMLGGALVLLVGLGASAKSGPLALEGVALLVIVVAAAEAAVGLTLLVALARRSRRTRIDEVTEVKG